MKLATEPYEEPQKDRGISRMILVSAVLHVIVIGSLIVTGYFHSTKLPETQLPSYEVTLVGPTGTGKRKTPGEKDSTLPRQAKVEKPIAPTAKGEQREALPPKPQEKPKPEVPVKPTVKEPPSEKPRAVAKQVEPPKPKPTPVVKEKEPPKAVAAVKPEKKTPPPSEKKAEEVKAKEPTKPRVTARLSEKKEKPKEEPPPQPERVKAQEKKSETRKPEEKSKAQPVQSKPEKKPQASAKTTAKEKVSEPKTTESADTPAKKQTAPVPAATKAAPSEDAAQERQDEEARNNLIASAVERVRSREETGVRERDIAKAVDRVRLGVGGQEENDKGPAKQAAIPNAHTEKNDGDGLPAKAKVYGPEFLAYTEDIKQRVKEGWIVADRKPGLKAVVRFGVEADGAVVDVELADPSGDRSFDQSALRAVKNAKLPPPPEMYREDFAIQKVHMTFGGEE